MQFHGAAIAVDAVVFGADILPLNACAVNFDKLALSFNVFIKGVPFNEIVGVINVPPVSIVIFGADTRPVKDAPIKLALFEDKPFKDATKVFTL